ncbi:MAG: esterase family protein [Bacteroidaceae bacterium]|nr:esterase family protein [Bacteroidaceae bacterium]
MSRHTLHRLWLTLSALVFALSAHARIVRDSLQSRVLGTTKYYTVYTPAGFNHNPQQHYPVLYLLHGFTDDDRAWQDKGQMDRVADELIASGEIQPMIIVMPNAGGPDTKNIWNGYFNMTGWAYEDFFYQEFLPTVEEKYRAGGSRGQRAVAGLSMGGGGSVGYALGHPDMFSSCYAMSAWFIAEERTGVSPDDKVGLLTNAVSKRSPFDALKKASEEEMDSYRKIVWFIDCGDDDFLFEQNINLYKELRKHRLNAQLRVRDGGHTWEYWHNALRLCLPFVSRNFSK